MFDGGRSKRGQGERAIQRQRNKQKNRTTYCLIEGKANRERSCRLLDVNWPELEIEKAIQMLTETKTDKKIDQHTEKQEKGRRCGCHFIDVNWPEVNRRKRR